MTGGVSPRLSLMSGVLEHMKRLDGIGCSIVATSIPRIRIDPNAAGSPQLRVVP